MKSLKPAREIHGASPTRGGLQPFAGLSDGRLMPLWLIPMIYTVASVTAGLIFPRMEHAYLADYAENISVGSALAFFSSVSSGMMALTGIVFAIAFVLVQFNAIAYSPRLVVLFAGSPRLFHTLGIFFATFFYSLAAIVWTDRGGSGRVPLFSTLLVAILLIVSMVAFARLVQSLNDLQIQNVLRFIGARGRSVIRVMLPVIADSADVKGSEPGSALGPVTQTLTHSGEPRVITRFDLDGLVRLAQNADAVVAIECGVGDTLVEDAVLLRVHGPAESCLSRHSRRPFTLGLRAVSSRTRSMPFVCSLISRSGRCRQRSMTRRRQCRRLIRSRIYCGGSGAASSTPAMPATRTARSGSRSPHRRGRIISPFRLMKSGNTAQPRSKSGGVYEQPWLGSARRSRLRTVGPRFRSI